MKSHKDVMLGAIKTTLKEGPPGELQTNSTREQYRLPSGNTFSASELISPSDRWCFSRYCQPVLPSGINYAGMMMEGKQVLPHQIMTRVGD